MECETMTPKSSSLLPLIIHQLKFKRQRQLQRPQPQPPTKASPPTKAYVIRCNAATTNLNLHEIRQIHGHMIVTHFDYSCQTIPGSLLRRRLTTPESQHNFLFSSYNRSGAHKTSLAIYAHLRRNGVHVDTFNLPSVLKACGECSLLALGREVHGYAIKNQIDRDVFVWNSLMQFYGGSARVDLARRLFDEMTEKDCVSWNTMISSCVRNWFLGEALGLVHNFAASGIELDEAAMVGIGNLVVALNDAAMAKAMHGYIVRHGISGVKIATSLVDVYGKSGNSAYALRFFKGSPDCQGSVVTWTAIIADAMRNGVLGKALGFVQNFVASGIELDEIAMLGISNLVVALNDAAMAKAMHGYIVRHGISGVQIATSLVDVYGQSGNSAYAFRFFKGSPDCQGSKVAWTVIIADAIRRGAGITRFRKMLKSGIVPNHFMLLSLVSKCGLAGNLRTGRKLHEYIAINYNTVSPHLAAAIINMYIRCDDLLNARNFFDHCSDRDSGIWSAMISAYIRTDRIYEARSLLVEMPREGMKIIPATIASLIALCSEVGSLELGKWVHSQINEQGVDVDLVVKTSLLNMYAKCGDLNEAQQLFIEATERDICMWNAMINGFAMHGCGEKALELFSEMEKLGVKPNKITFISILNACSHAGQVCQGQSLFDKMLQFYGLVPEIEHYGCMVDLFGRAGRLAEAREIIDGMPIKPNSVVWGSLLAACKVHNDLDLAEVAAEKIAELEPENQSYSILMSNVYANAKQWNNVAETRTAVKDNMIRKPNGQSSVEVGGLIHDFVAGDKAHWHSGEIYEKLTEMNARLKEAGHVPNTSVVFQNIDEEDKEVELNHHSEKLAIAFGLIGTAAGAPIRIVKNLRVCEDCHEFTKLVSKIYGRTIIVRDRKRFHHFIDGSCSCGEYW